MEGTSSHGEHEHSDISVRAVGKYGLWILLGTFLSMGLMWLLYDRLEAREQARALTPPPMAKANPRTQPPEPRLEADAAQSLADYRAAEESRIHSYGWVDAENGIVRLPIERAMELVAKEGLPSREAARK